MKKKILLSLILSASMLFSACSFVINDKVGNSDGDKASSSDSAKPEDTKKEEETLKYVHGKIEGNKYSSDFLGLHPELGEGWTLYTDEQLAKQNSISDMSEENVNKALEKKGVLYEIMASQENNENFNIVIENLNVTNNGNTVSGEEYLKLSLPTLKTSLKSGYDESSADIDKVTFMGKETACIKADVTKEELHAYLIIVPVIKGNYAALITFTAFSAESAESMIAVFK
ncbi:MAG: hypothetical protein K2J79_01620 [Ruminiclostridium sp.]|nr:hypothetical protein [Ruminiclostridium sp.]